MSALSNGEILATTVELINQRATLVANEEIEHFLADHENALIDGEIRGIVNQRATSELMLRMSHFVPGEDIADRENLTARFEKWFAENEATRLHQMCNSCIGEELKKHEIVGDDHLTFTEKFQKLVKDRSKSGSAVNLMKNLSE